MSLACLTILRDRLSTTKTDTVLFFLVLSYLLQIEHKAMLLYFTGDGLCSLEQVVDIDLYFRGGGLSNYSHFLLCLVIFFFFFFFSFSVDGDFFWGGGLFGQGRDIF